MAQKLNLRKICFLLLLLLWATPSFALDSLTYLTEEYPPYNYREDGQLKGISIDLLVAASAAMGSPVTKDDIRLRPWPRGYRAVLNKPNTALFAMARTKQRESLFKWVGPIGETRIVVLAKKSQHIKINSGADLANYSIGVILDDVGEQLVLTAGADINKIERTTTAVALAKMLDFERIQLWAYEENVARWSIEKAGINSENFEVVYVLHDLALYYAFHRDTDDKLIEKLQKGLDKLKQNQDSNGKSLYHNILIKYLPETSL